MVELITGLHGLVEPTAAPVVEVVEMVVLAVLGTLQALHPAKETTEAQEMVLLHN
jgi:hypothetical protein